MGKGKGTFEFWACRQVVGKPPTPFASLFLSRRVLTCNFCANRAKMGRVIFEIGGPNLRPEMAHAGASRSIPSPPLPLISS